MAEKKKPKEASELFHNIMKASVTVKKKVKAKPAKKDKK
jgi:hypothetical protein